MKFVVMYFGSLINGTTCSCASGLWRLCLRRINAPREYNAALMLCSCASIPPPSHRSPPSPLQSTSRSCHITCGGKKHFSCLQGHTPAILLPKPHPSHPSLSSSSHLQVGHLEVTLHRDRVLLGICALDVNSDRRHGFLAATHVKESV